MFHPFIHFSGFTFSSWLLFGLGNILIGKLLILYIGVRRGWNFVHWTVILLVSTLGGSLAAWLVPSIMSVALGAVGFLLLAKRLLGFRHEVSDLIAVFLAVAIGIGRIGCLVNGCCFGAPTHLPWGITYPVGSPAHWLHLFTGRIGPSQSMSLAVHPIQVYESIFMAVALIVILVFNRVVRRKTVLLLGFLGAYFWFRFFLEFIRDMTNVWWGEIVWGPFSVFQWFLLLVGAFLLLLAVKQQQQPARLYSPTIRLDPEWLLGITGAGILLGHTYFQPVQLIQLLVFFPFGVVGVLWEHRRQPVIRTALTGLGGTVLFVLLFTSLTSRILARDERPQSPGFRLNTPSNWLYVINPADQKLVRFGDEQLSFQEYLRKQKALNWQPGDGRSDSARYDDLRKALSRRTMTYFGVAGLGRHEFQATGCGGNIITYQRRYRGAAFGWETKIPKERHITYRGLYGSLFEEDWTATHSGEGYTETYRRTYGLLNFYTNFDWKYIGVGVGGFFFAGRQGGQITNELVLPNGSLRIGTTRFSLEGGINDRALIRPDPLTLHLNALMRWPSGLLRFGLLPMGTMTEAFFINGSWQSAGGLTWNPTIIFTDGVGFNLKLDYMRPQSGKR